MSDYIYFEAGLAVHSFLLGVILMISYDLLRLLRLFIPHHVLAVGVEDLLYWLYCAVLTFLLLFYENSGELRGYVIAGVFLGMLLYDRLVSLNMLRMVKKGKIWFTIKAERGTIKARKREIRNNRSNARASKETKEKGENSHGTASKSADETEIEI